jgi:hypothetical protein
MDNKIFTLATLPKYDSKAWFGFILNHDDYYFHASYSDKILNIWDDRGIESVCSYSFDEISQSDTIKEIENILDKYIEGYAICSCCRKPISRDEIGCTFCAGVYCKECATPEIKQEAEWFRSHLD